jgi:hypothetical protein
MPYRRSEDALDIELRMLLDGCLAGPVVDPDEVLTVTTERPPRLGLMQAVTFAATVAWLALGIALAGGPLRALVWLVAAPFAVAAVVFGLDVVLAGLDRVRAHRAGRSPAEAQGQAPGLSPRRG